MKLTGLTVALAVSAVATGAQAKQAAPPAAPAPAQSAQNGSEGVVSYPPEFFASAQPQSAMDMILRVPGFNFTPGEQVRGFAGAAGNVLVDGQRPTTKTDPLEAVLRRIPASTVERIDLIRGGAPGIDMQGQTVVVNVVRKTGSSSQALWAVASAYYADGRTNPFTRFEGSRRWDGKFVEGSLRIYSYIDDGGGEGPRITRDSAGNIIQRAISDDIAGGKGVETKGSFETSLFGGKFSTNVLAKVEEYQRELNDVADFPAPFEFRVQDDFDEKFRGEIGAQWSRELGPRTSFEILALQTFRDTVFNSVYEDVSDTLDFTQATTNGESIVRSKVRWAKSDALQFETGGEIAYNFLDRATSLDVNGAPIVLPAANVLVEETRAEVFGAMTWRPMPAVTVEAGTRIEYSVISQSGDTNLEESFVYPKPRLFVTWAPNEQNQFRFRVEREVGQLNFGDFVSSAQLSTGVVTAGNANLVPFQAWTGAVTYEHRFWERGALVLGFAYSRIEDVVDRIPVIDLASCPLVGGIPDPNSPLCDFFSGVGNIDEGESTTLSANLTLPLDRLGIKGGIFTFEGAWNDSEAMDPTTHRPRRIIRSAPFRGEMNFAHDIPSWTLNWGLDAFFGFQETSYGVDQIEQVELQTRYRLWAEWGFKPQWSLRVEAQNLSARDLIRQRDVHGGLRSNTPLAYREDTSLTFEPFIYFRLRRIWG